LSDSRNQILFNKYYFSNSIAVNLAVESSAYHSHSFSSVYILTNYISANASC